MPDRRTEIWPPYLEKELRGWLGAQFPAASESTISFAAFHIDGQVRALFRSEYTLKIGRKPRQWSNQRSRRRYGAVSYSLTRRPTIAEALDRFERAARSKKDWIWAKAWHEAPLEVIALLEEVAGPKGLWRKVPSRLPLDPGWARALAGAGYSVHTDDPQPLDLKFSINVAGAPIPHATSVAPLIPQARRLIRPGRPETLWRNVHVAEIVRAFEQLTGTRVAMPAHEAGSSRRSGPIIDFLDRLEAFYSERLPEPFERLHFSVQHSGHAWTRIFAMLGRA